MSAEEEELQRALGFGGRVEWSVTEIEPNVPHAGEVLQLLGSDPGDTVMVCDCGWAMRFDKAVGIKEAERVFLGHAQPNFDVRPPVSASIKET